MLKIIAIGRTQMLYDSIVELSCNDVDIPLIVTCKESAEYEVSAEDFKALAEKIGADFIFCEGVLTEEVARKIKRFKPDLGISINWKTLIKKEVIELFKHGIVNSHPGDLPDYKGNACPNWAMINNEKQIGISFHLMDRELDSGNILRKIFFQIDDNTRIAEFYTFWKSQAPKIFLEIVKELRQNAKLQSIPQSGEGFRCYPRRPEDSLINWSQSASEILRLINASSSPFVGAYTFFDNVKLYILEASTTGMHIKYFSIPGQVAFIDKKNEEVHITTGKGFLIIKTVKYKKSVFPPTYIIKSTYTRIG